jgi:predicted flap endonuclease-1-like 5' DNA nuclease
MAIKIVFPCLIFTKIIYNITSNYLTKNSTTMAYKIDEIEGIGPVYAEKLGLASIKTVEGLLEAGKDKAGRKKIAETTGIDEGKILDWVNMADLFRIKGVSSQNAEILKAAGVDTVKELRTRNAENLHKKIVEVNEEKKLVRQVPSLAAVQDFIEQAKSLDPVITY